MTSGVDEKHIEKIRTGLLSDPHTWTTEGKKLFLLLKILDELRALNSVPDERGAPDDLEAVSDD